MLTLRRHSNSKPWWIFGALLFPLLALPFTGPDHPRAIGGLMFVVFALVHLLQVPAAFRLGEGRPAKIFGMVMLMMVPSIVGDTAATLFMIQDSGARLAANGFEQKCGMSALLVFFVPFASAIAHVIGGLILASLTAVFQRLTGRLPEHA